MAQKRASLDAPLAYDSQETVKDGMEILLCQCCGSSSDRETVGSMGETARPKPYVLLNQPEKEVTQPIPDPCGYLQRQILTWATAAPDSARTY